MGWGTFIAGRVLRSPAKKDPMGDIIRMQKASDRLAEEHLYLETQVLKAINILKSQGVDPQKIDRNELRESLKFYYRKKADPHFKLKVVRKAQEQSLAGENADLEYLELLEIRKMYKQKKSLVREICLWFLFPYYQIWRYVFKGNRSLFSKTQPRDNDGGSVFKF